MKRSLGFYPKLAWTGICKNKRTYLPYILTCTGMVMMYYIVSFLSVNQSVRTMRGGAEIQGMLGLGCGIIAVFALIFLFYTNSFLIRRRKKEFGLYNILGMGKSNIARILLWESIMVSVISLVCGLGCGILFSKLAELCVANILENSVNFVFAVEMESIWQSVLLFTVIYVLIYLNSLRQIHVSKPVELLHSENVGEKPPKANWFLALVGVVLLAGAYYIAVKIEDPLTALVWFFVAVIMVIIATYLLFVAGSVVICKILQKNKKYYYKTNHFVSVSSMMYRMKRNGAGLASICILSTMVLVMISTTASLNIGKEDSMCSRYPRNIIVQTYAIDEQADEVRAVVGDVLAQKQVEPENVLYYQYMMAGAYFDGSHGIFDQNKLSGFQLNLYENVRQVYFISLDDYNRVMGANETLDDGEVLIYSTKSDFLYDEISFDGSRTFRVKKIVPEFVENGADAMQIIPSICVFFSDLSEIDQVLAAQSGVLADNYCRDYYGFDLSCEDSQQIDVYSAIREAVRALQNEEGFAYVDVESVAAERESFYALYGGLFFLGILLGIVFLFSAVLIMYYKQITEGYEDQSRFDIMQKVGMTKKEIKKSVNSQVLTVFFLPLLAAGVHLAFAFPMVSKLLALFSLTNTRLMIAITICCYLIFALFYVLVYRTTSRAYYRIVSAGEEKGV